MNRLSNQQIDRLCDFFGYGPANAPVWFLGMEEQGREPEHLIRRLQFQRFEDLRRAHVEILGISERHQPPFSLQRTWNRMCELMLILHGQAPSVKLKKIYQANYIGSELGDSLLLELMPLPFPTYTGFIYEDIMRRFGTKDGYRDEVKPLRIAAIKDMLEQNRERFNVPRVVICYGVGDWDDYRLIFSDREFEYQKDLQPGWKVAYSISSDSVIFLTPHLYLLPMSYMWRLSEIIFDLFPGFRLAYPPRESAH